MCKSKRKFDTFLRVFCLSIGLLAPWTSWSQMSVELDFYTSGRNRGPGTIIVPGSLSPDGGRPGVNFSDRPPVRNSPDLLTEEQKALFTNPNRPRSKEEADKIVEDLKKIRDYLERIEREGLDKDFRSADGQLKLKSKEEVAQEVEKIKQGLEKTMSTSLTSSLPILKKYKELYQKEGKLSQEDVKYLIENNLIKGVIPPHELSIEDNPDDGLDSYRDTIYGHNTSLNEREIIRANNYHSHAFLRARWDMASRMKKGEDLRNFTSIEHFQAAEALSRANIHYANRLLNKESPTSNDMIIGKSLLGDAKSVGDFALGVANGITSSIIATMNGIPALVGMGYNAIKDYNKTIDQVHRLIEQFDGNKFFAAIGDFFENKWDQFAEGDASVRGEMIGALFAEITTMFIPGTAVVKAANGAAKYSIPIVKTIGQTRMGKFIESAAKIRIETPFGEAYQSLTKESIIVKLKVEKGAKIYRLGTRGTSQTGKNAQFWSFENPNTPGYGKRYGIPQENIENSNFIETATTKPNSVFITRPAPPSPDGLNPGGGIEIVLPKDSVIIEGHLSI